MKDYADRYGVIYPLQTFTKSQDMRALEVPLCLESDFVRDDKEQQHSCCCRTSSQECGGSYELMWNLARELSPVCHEVSEEQRARMHVAAVFACNFSNAMYQIAYKLLEENGLPFDILIPLLRQTVEKVSQMSPAEAQTGPAVRGDWNVMRTHLAELEDERLQELYRMMSEIIMKEKGLEPREQ